VGVCGLGGGGGGGGLWWGCVVLDGHRRMALGGGAPLCFPLEGRTVVCYPVFRCVGALRNGVRLWFSEFGGCGLRFRLGAVLWRPGLCFGVCVLVFPSSPSPDGGMSGRFAFYCTP